MIFFIAFARGYHQAPPDHRDAVMAWKSSFRFVLAGIASAGYRYPDNPVPAFYRRQVTFLKAFGPSSSVSP